MVEIPWEVIDTACRLNATLAQVSEACASVGRKIDPKTIERAIRREHDMTFAQYRDQKTDGTRLKLVQQAIKLGLGGNVSALIFCLKNMCGWNDSRPESEVARAKSLLEVQRLQAEIKARFGDRVDYKLIPDDVLEKVASGELPDAELLKYITPK